MDHPNTANAQVELAAAIAAWLTSLNNYNHGRNPGDYCPHYGQQIETPLMRLGVAFLKAAGLPYEASIAEDELPAPARRRPNRTPMPQDLRWAVFARDNYTCQRCGSGLRLEADHIKPYSLGGPTTFENLQTLCHDCNAAKGARV